jgi:hypothetical protein
MIATSFQWLAMLLLFAAAVYFCLGMAYGWPIAPFFVGFGIAFGVMFVGFLFRSRRE